MFNKLIGGAAVAPIEAVGNILDNLFTSDEEKLDKEIIKQKLAQNLSLVQAEINKVEASHRSIFVAGWRPFIGWVCGCSLAWHFMIYDMVVFIFPDRAIPSLSGTEQLVTILLSMLGLGGLRTFEKFSGKAK